jgi:hypothetical protein
MRAPRSKPSRAARNQRRYRERFARGEMVYRVALPCEVVEALIRWRWVERHRADDRAAVERAVEAGLTDAETAALLLFAAASSRAETLDQLYEKAKLDKALFYSGGPTAPHENRAKEFMQKYPGIAVLVTGSFSNVLNERIEKQMADRKLEVDMAFFQTVQDFVSWKKQGRLLAFKPEGFDQIKPSFRDEDGTYMALCLQHLSRPPCRCAAIGAGVSCRSTAGPILRPSGRSGARESWRSCGRRSTRRLYSRLPVASSRMRHIPMPPSSISHGSWPGSSRAASARSRRASTCRRLKASNRSRLTKLPTTIGSS